jgi:hypothetical protein
VAVGLNVSTLSAPEKERGHQYHPESRAKTSMYPLFYIVLAKKIEIIGRAHREYIQEFEKPLDTLDTFSASYVSVLSCRCPQIKTPMPP